MYLKKVEWQKERQIILYFIRPVLELDILT